MRPEIKLIQDIATKLDAAVKRIDNLAENAINDRIRRNGRNGAARRRSKSACSAGSNATRRAAPSDCDMDQTSQRSNTASEASASTAGSGAARAALIAKLKTLNIDLANVRR